MSHFSVGLIIDEKDATSEKIVSLMDPFYLEKWDAYESVPHLRGKDGTFVCGDKISELDLDYLVEMTTMEKSKYDKLIIKKFTPDVIITENKWIEGRHCYSNRMNVLKYLKELYKDEYKDKIMVLLYCHN